MTNHNRSNSCVKIGYALINNVSSDFRPQLKMLEEKGCQKVYQDIATSFDSERPGLSELILEIGLSQNIDIYCRNFLTMFCTVDAFVPVAELAIENNSSLIFLEDDIKLSNDNGLEIILLWLDLLDFKVKHRSRRRISKKNRNNN